MELLPIPHKDKIKNLYKPGAKLKNISYKFAIPSPEILGHVGVDRETILALEDSELYEVDIVLKAKPRQNLSTSHKLTKKILDSLRISRGIDDIKFEASEPYRKNRQYTFMDDFLFYSVDISETKTENKIVIPLSVDEYTSYIEDKLIGEYRKNENYILLASNSVEESE